MSRTGSSPTFSTMPTAGKGLPSGNTYFWYTEDGQHCYYHVDTNGNLVGGPDGTSGDNPLRK